MYNSSEQIMYGNDILNIYGRTDLHYIMCIVYIWCICMTFLIIAEKLIFYSIYNFYVGDHCLFVYDTNKEILIKLKLSV